MAATETLPSTTHEPPLTTAELVQLTGTIGPIAEIMESAPIKSVDVDIMNSVTKAVLSSDVINLEIVALEQEFIDDAVGQLIGGKGFLYSVDEDRDHPGWYYLEVTSFISPLQTQRFAEALQSVSSRITVYTEGHLVAAL
jgi:hypothetical protein